MEKEFEARRAFGDLLAMYDLRSADGRDLVTEAAELLVAGIGGPAVIDLASEIVTPLTSPFEIDALVDSARDELGMPMLDPDWTAVRAAVGQLRRWGSGLITDQEIARWAHEAIGHGGSESLQDLVVLDDKIDLLGSTDATPESIHVELEAIAITFLAYPDPWAEE